MSLQNYSVTLTSPVSRSFRCQKAANSLDIDAAKKSVHHLAVEADIESDYNIGVIVGASGAGKTTLARQMFGQDCFEELLTLTKPIIDQFPEGMDYDSCAAMLTGVGLTSVPCWIRPAATLSNGQRARAEIALQMAMAKEGVAVIDEWTSVVDRTVAKVMSHCIQKHARKTGRRIVLLSCHYDVLEWLNPDWVIDCNRQTFEDRRLLWRSAKRTEELRFDIREVDKATWSGFSKYHYLSDVLPGGIIFTFGIFNGDDQIGFQCFANYVPRKKGTTMILHSNRTVVHPDYAGMGLGIMLINETSALMHARGYRIMAKFSSTPIFRAMSKQPCWRHFETARRHKMVTGNNSGRETGFRLDVKTFSFEFIPGKA